MSKKDLKRIYKKYWWPITLLAIAGVSLLGYLTITTGAGKSYRYSPVTSETLYVGVVMILSYFAAAPAPKLQPQPLTFRLLPLCLMSAAYLMLYAYFLATSFDYRLSDKLVEVGALLVCGLFVIGVLPISDRWIYKYQHRKRR